MKILIYGNSHITAIVEKALGDLVIGHVPSKNPTFPGIMQSPVVTSDEHYDIAISIQYDQKIARLENAYNLHTGLLPLYGGCDILYHTIVNKEKKQGLTFHKIGENFDEGEIISTTSYPVLESDKAVDLYKKICIIAPGFVKNCLKLLEISTKGMPVQKPVLFKRGKYPKGDVLKFDIYEKDYEDIKAYVES